MPATAEVPVACRVTLTYAGDVGYEPVEVDVLDGRAAGPIDLEVSGFTLLQHTSAVTDWLDPVEVDRVHAPEVVAIAREATGCDAVAVYPALLRNPEAARTTADHAPIHLVHSDFTDDYRPMVTEVDRPYQAFLQPILERWGIDHAEVVAARRLMVFQLWRNVGPERPDHPLAFCDARDVGPERCLPFRVEEYGGQRLAFETFGFRPPAEGEVDRWHTFPGLTRDEVVALRTYDSACQEAGRPFWTPHSAFRDPAVGDGPEHHRASVELRALCLWR